MRERDEEKVEREGGKQRLFECIYRGNIRNLNCLAGSVLAYLSGGSGPDWRMQSTHKETLGPLVWVNSRNVALCGTKTEEPSQGCCGISSFYQSDTLLRSVSTSCRAKNILSAKR